MENNRKEHRIGFLCAVASAIIWGVLPIYWKSLGSLDSVVLMLYRFILSFLVLFIICFFVIGIKGMLAPLKDKKKVLTFFLAGLVISINWNLYIWAVHSGFIIQTSLGYYIDPLFVAILGLIVFHEKFNKYKTIAVIFAIIGVCIMIISHRQLPTIALVLAASFAIYTAIKKKQQAPAILSLLYETGLLLPVIIPITIYMEVSGKGVFANADTKEFIILSFTGIVTAAPLVFFGMAANRISIVSLGLIEYIGPSLGLIIGIFMYSEPFDLIQLTGFFIIWIGLAIFTYGEFKSHPKLPSTSQ